MKSKLFACITLVLFTVSGLSISPTSAATNPCANKDRLYFATWKNAGSKVGWVYTNCASDTTFHDLNLGTSSITDGGGTLTLDPSSGTVYVTDWANKIHLLSLDQSIPGSTLTFTGETLVNPWGIAIDPAAKRLYVANYGNGKLLTGTLDAKVLSEVNLVTHGIEDLDSIDDLRIDTQSNRLYISNDGFVTVSQQISWISTNSDTGAKLNLGTATQATINGFAIDKKKNKIFWTNFSNGSAEKVPVSGVDLGTGGPTELLQPAGEVSSPQQLLVNEAAGEIYWVKGSTIFKSTMPSTESTPFRVSQDGWISGMALLKSPQLVAKPKISVTKTKNGNVIKCVAAKWEKDRAWSGTFNAPKTQSLYLLKDGKLVKRYTAAYTTKVKGTYTCRSSATNAAGSSTSTSNPIKITK